MTEDTKNTSSESEKEAAIRAKMEELRPHSHDDVDESKLRNGAMFALGLK